MIQPYCLGQDCIGNDVGRCDAIRVNMGQDARDVNCVAVVTARTPDSISKNDKRCIWFQASLGNGWFGETIDAYCVRGFIEPDELVFVAEENWAAGIATDDKRLGNEINAYDVKLGTGFATALGAKIVMGGTGNRAITHALCQEANGFANDDVADGFGAAPAALTVSDDNADTPVRAFYQFDRIPTLGAGILVDFCNG